MNECRNTHMVYCAREKCELVVSPQISDIPENLCKLRSACSHIKTPSFLFKLLKDLGNYYHFISIKLVKIRMHNLFVALYFNKPFQKQLNLFAIRLNLMAFLSLSNSVMHFASATDLREKKG